MNQSQSKKKTSLFLVRFFLFQKFFVILYKLKNMKKKEPVKKTTKKVSVKKEVTKKPYKKRELSAGAEFYKNKKKALKKKKDVYLCSKCLEEVQPNLLQWVSVTDQFNETFGILICEDCIEHKECYIDRYSSFEIVKPLIKKRVYKKKA